MSKPDKDETIKRICMQFDQMVARAAQNPQLSQRPPLELHRMMLCVMMASELHDRDLQMLEAVSTLQAACSQIDILQRELNALDAKHHKLSEDYTALLKALQTEGKT